MEFSKVQCPFGPHQMVMVLTLDMGDEATGMALMESLTPDERQALFKACAWYRENRDWDRKSYALTLDGLPNTQTAH